MRAAQSIGLKARVIDATDPARLERAPTPAIARRRDGQFVVFGGKLASGNYRIVDPITHLNHEVSPEDYISLVEPRLVLLNRRIGGAGVDPKTFGFYWFLPTSGVTASPWGRC